MHACIIEPKAITFIHKYKVTNKLTIHLLHSLDEVTRILKADEPEPFAFICPFISYHFRSLERTVFTEGSCLQINKQPN